MPLRVFLMRVVVLIQVVIDLLRVVAWFSRAFSVDVLWFGSSNTSLGRAYVYKRQQFVALDKNGIEAFGQYSAGG